MIGTVFIAVFMVALAAAQTSGPANDRRPSIVTCASTSCLFGAACKEVYYPALGIIRGRCLDPPPPTGNELVCGDGQPLYVNNTRGIVEASCGRSSERIDCPAGYYCKVHQFDKYAVCCPGYESSRCPEIKEGDVGICAFMCDSDGECGRGGKCCPTACGGTSCHPARGKRSTPQPTCETKICPPGFECQMKLPSDCIWRKPCFEEPICVAIPPKEGVCSATIIEIFDRSIPDARPHCRRLCTRDQDCPGILKCCTNPEGCGTSCQNPEPEITCENTECATGLRCEMKQYVCVRAPCFPVPECVP